MGEHTSQKETTMFAQPPSIADKKLVETLCTVRAIQRGTAERLRFLARIFSLGYVFLQYLYYDYCNLPLLLYYMYTCV